MAAPEQAAKIVERLLRLVNVDDEPVLHELVTNWVFHPAKKVAGVSLEGSAARNLMTFFLGYCRSDEQVARANLLQFQKKELKIKDFFVPLLDDWFIRPLYFVEGPDDSDLQTLTQAAYSYFGECFATSGCCDVVRVTKSEVGFLTVYLIHT